jgi:N-methylhydantoinase B/oxoprolinase/acetone carboxylase alpha subunit
MGKTTVVRQDGSLEHLPGKFSTRLRKGERIRIETPGAGGWGNVGTDAACPERSRRVCPVEHSEE